ncbi:MAG TPA: hypothetical protein VF545_03685, partial [Thermoleophilaceae bacterium]
MTIPRNKLGHLIAAVGAAVLFVFLFVGWFGGGRESASAWQSFTVVDIVLAALALVVLAYAGLHLLNSAQGLPRWATPQLVTAAGALAAILTLLFMIEVSQASDLKFGAFVSLLASLAMAAGGYFVQRPDKLEDVMSAAGQSAPGAPAPHPGAA